MSVDVSSKYHFTNPARGLGDGNARERAIKEHETKIFAQTRQSSVELKCQAPSGKQIKTCLFQVTIDEEEEIYKIGRARNDLHYHRAIVATTEGGGTSRVHAFVDE